MTLFGYRLSKARLTYFHDLAMAAAAVLVALYLRVGDDIGSYRPVLATGTLVLTAIASVVFRMSGMYRGVWRYASVNDLMTITRAVSLTVLLFLPAMFLVNRLDSFPRSLPVIIWFVLMALLGGPRFLYRRFKDRRSEARAVAADRRLPVLLVGCDDDAELFIRATQRNPHSLYRAVAMVSQTSSRVGRNIHGVEVLGTIDQLDAIIERLAARSERPQKVVLADEHLVGTDIRGLLEKAERHGLPLARAPKVTDFQAIGDKPVQVRPIAIEDLLGRPQTVLDRDGMSAMVGGRRVMVTGAGGSIGSELVRQIVGLDPSAVLLVDSSEYALYQIDLEMAETAPHVHRVSLLGDVRNRDRIGEIFRRHRPELVFHAAALKHVPMVEANPLEGILTNVVGSRNVADACAEFGARAMVMISTDKAVNPTNVMGATKRVAEMYCQAMDVVHVDTRFVTVRFGNVLGSTGSVVPLFQRQLARGGPLTVTHPDVVRYFMTIREAVELVLQASVLGTTTHSEGKIHVLDMGEPVRIMDLALQMIRLAGLQPDVDVRIEITGLRPGEKLFEEIFHGSEPLVRTGVDGVLLASPRAVDLTACRSAIGEFEVLANRYDTEGALATLRAMVPEFTAGLPSPA